MNVCPLIGLADQPDVRRILDVQIPNHLACSLALVITMGTVCYHCGREFTEIPGYITS